MKVALVSIAIVALVGLGLWLFMKGGNETSTIEGGEQDAMETANNGEMNMMQAEMVSAALAGSGSVRCEWSDTDNNWEGVALIKDGNMRVESVDAQGQASNVIYGEEYVYMWQEGGQGTKISRDALAQMQAQGNAQVQTRAEIEATVKNEQQAQCEGGAVSDDAFVPPSSIEFQDLSAMMDAAAQAAAQAQLQVQ